MPFRTKLSLNEHLTLQFNARTASVRCCSTAPSPSNLNFTSSLTFKTRAEGGRKTGHRKIIRCPSLTSQDKRLLGQYCERHAGAVGSNRSAGSRARVEADHAVVVGAEVAYAGLVISQRRITDRVSGVDGAGGNRCNGKFVATLPRSCNCRRQDIVNQASIGHCRSRTCAGVPPKAASVSE